jgi:uncharacterized protein (DUF2267 family)
VVNGIILATDERGKLKPSLSGVYTMPNPQTQEKNPWRDRTALEDITEALSHHKREIPEDRTPEEVAHLIFCRLNQQMEKGKTLDQLLSLPKSIHDFMKDCEVHAEGKVCVRNHTEFFELIGRDLGIEPYRARALVKTVFITLQSFYDLRDVTKVAYALPHDLGEFWNYPETRIYKR